nr:serine-rich 25 kDa antigen protein-like [Misgurnus anguillicaudatus]
MDIKISYFLFSCVLLWTGSDGNSNGTTSPSPPSNFTTAANISDPLPNASSTSSPILSSSTTGNIMEDGAIAPTTEPTSFVKVTSSLKPDNQTGNSSTEKENTNSTTTNQTSLSKDSSTRRPGSVTTQKPKSTSTLHNQGSSGKSNDDQKPTENSEKKYLWILLPVLCVLLAAAIYLKSRCKKVQHRPEMTDNGTENASFQRTDSNKDGVMLLGVSKTSGGEDNASAI